MTITFYVKWLPLIGFEGYKIANNGMVKKGSMLLNIKIHPRSKYRFIRIYKKIGKREMGFHLDIHKQVFIHFSTEKLLKGNQVHHKDFDYTNNHIDNLMQVTRSYHWELHVLHNKSKKIS